VKVTLVMSTQLTIEGYPFCMRLKSAFDSLISERYVSFILTVGCIAVGISYCDDNGHFKVFDSHARDIYGISHPQETCTIRYIICRQLSALLSKFIWSKWSFLTKRFTHYKIWHGNKQQCKRGIKEIIRSTQVLTKTTVLQ